MEKKKTDPVPEGQDPKSDVDIVAEVLADECPSSTFLMNVGLQSGKKLGKSNAVVAAHVRDLEDRLEMSQLQTVAMKEEVAALRKKSEEAEAAQAVRDKEYELLRKKAEEQEERFSHLMALLGGRAAGN